MTEINFAADTAVVSIAEQQRQLAARTKNLEIVNAEGFTAAAEYLKIIKSNLAQLEEQRTRITGPLNASLREVNSQAREAAQPWLDLEAKIKGGLLQYNKEQDRIRLEAQRKADAEAAKERARLQAIADAAAEKARQEAQERRKAAEAAAAAGRAEEAAKFAAQAARIEEKGAAKQEAFESRAASVVAPVVQSAAPKVSGVGARDNWTYRIVDPAKISAQFLIPDEIKIGKIVRSLKKEAETLVGGIEVSNDRLIASGRA